MCSSGFPWVADAALPGGSQGLHTLTEIDELPLSPQTSEMTFSGDRRQTSRVVTAVLQLPKTFKQLGCCGLGPNQGNDSAHKKARHKSGRAYGVITLASVGQAHGAGGLIA